MAEPELSIVEVIDDNDDIDSAIGTVDLDQEDLRSTTSIGTSIMRYRQENGRTYHAYKDGRYLLPNDENEQNRLGLQHYMYYLTLGGRLYAFPLPQDQKLDRVLDLGCGTGIWAMDFADEHPESMVFSGIQDMRAKLTIHKVLGVDLSPIQPNFLPPNCYFEIDDIEDHWTYKYKFDLIHIRMLMGTVMNWPRCFQQCYDNLNPGGWLEVKNMKFPIEDNDNSFPEDCAVREWAELMIEGMAKLGRSADSAKYYKAQMIEAGFVNVVETQYKWPQNKWPEDRKLKELGAWMLENFSSGLSGLSMAVFTRGLGWTQEKLEMFLMEVRESMKDPNIHGYYPIYVVYGQKPF